MKVEKFSDPAREKLEARLQKINVVIGQRKALEERIGTGEMKKDSSWEYTLWLGQKDKEGKKGKVIHAAKAVGHSIELLTGRRTQTEAELKKHDSVINPRLIEYRMAQLRLIADLSSRGHIPSEVYTAKIIEMQILLKKFKQQISTKANKEPDHPRTGRKKSARPAQKTVFAVYSRDRKAKDAKTGQSKTAVNEKIKKPEKVSLAVQLSEKLGIDVLGLNLNDIDLKVLQKLAAAPPGELVEIDALILCVPVVNYPNLLKRKIKARNTILKLVSKLKPFGIKIPSDFDPAKNISGYHLQYPEPPAENAQTQQGGQEQNVTAVAPEDPPQAQPESVVVAFKPKPTPQLVFENPGTQPATVRISRGKIGNFRIPNSNNERISVKTISPPESSEIPSPGNGEDQAVPDKVLTAKEAECLRLVKERGTGLTALKSIVKETGLGSIAELRQLFNNATLKGALQKEFQQARIIHQSIAQNHI